MESLTEQVLAYQQTGKGYPRLAEAVSLVVYNYPRRCCGFTEDDRGDFLLFFHPRISALVRRFRPMGKPFEVYLRSTLRWQLKSYAARKTRSQRRDRLFSRQDMWSDLTGDPVCAPGCEEDEPCSWDRILGAQRNATTDEAGRLRDRSLRKRLLIAGMKSSATLLPSEVDRLVRLTGISIKEIAHQCEVLRLRASSRLARYEVLSARRNRTFVRMQCLQEEVRETPAGDRLERLQRSYRKLARRFARASREATAVIRTPTHREIADVLGVPKGSVDSGIFYLRSAIEKGDRFCLKSKSGMLSS